MPTLIHDRFIVTGRDRARDLATGAEVSLDQLNASSPMRSRPLLTPLFDALEHAREGEPQVMSLQASDQRERRALAEAVADGAQQRGFVPVAVRLYDQARQLLGDELADRALVLIDAEDAGHDAHRCLMSASSVSARPHVLVSVLRTRPPGGVVREARERFGALARGLRPHPDVAHLQEKARRALALVSVGRHAAAARGLREIAACLERRLAFGEAARVGLDLGRLLLERGRLEDADACCENVVRLADRVSDAVLACEARLSQAWARLERMRVVDAESVARAVLLCVGGEPMSVCARAVLARCLIEQGRLRELSALDLDVEPTSAVDPVWLATVHDVACAALVATDRLFDAGQRVRRAIDAWPDTAPPLSTAILHTAHLRVVVCTGDLRLAESVLARALTAARQARAPVRALKARAAWCAGLARAGASNLVHAERRWLKRFASVAPPVVASEVDRALRHPAAPADGREGYGLRLAGRASGLSISNMAATMLGLAQEDGDADAVRAVLSHALRQIDASRLDVVSADAGPESSIVSVGSGPGSTLGLRVMEAGIVITATGDDECGVPVRLGSRLLGALTARWPNGRVVPGDRQEILECAAAIIAARVDGLQQRGREAAAATVEIPELVGGGSATTELRKAVLRAARAPFSVLIEGESGVGKELVARAIHYMSSRRERRFCDVNCAALPDDLFETELFGHAKGAFTGAVSERPGLFEEATGGTLFLDEVADLSLRAQAKLLRAVQQQEVRRVGESFARSVDVRFVAAANRQMAGEVEAGRFRADLLYRLDVVHIRIPALRERPEDIPQIAQHLWQLAAARVGSTATLTPGAVAALTQYAWPGNVRELQNVMAALAVAAPPRGAVRASLLPPVISAAAGVNAGCLAPARDQFERRFIEVALARAGGNRSRAARAIGLSRQGLLKSMARLGLRPSSDEEA
ncbi:MAG: sigma 54-interacting transcriptional regulator [Vicinamibacterales bacterium]